MLKQTFFIAALALYPAVSSAQTIVYDPTNFTKILENATTSKSILDTNNSLVDYNKQILQALNGTRSLSSILSGAGLGGGSSVSSGTAWGSLLGGSGLDLSSFSPEAQSAAATLVNGLNLASSLTSGGNTSLDQVYKSGVNTLAGLMALNSQAQTGAVNRASSFKDITGQLGSADDLKKSIDENSQLQNQTGQTVNELVGVTNGTVAAAANELQERVARQSAVVRFLDGKPSKSNPWQ